MRIPSKAVQYGYIEFPLVVEDGASPEALASVYVNFVYAYQKEEQAALLRLSDSLKGEAAPEPTKDAHEAAVAAVKDGLGATEVDENAAPWDKPAVDSKPKPWETEVTAPAVLDATW